MTVQCCVCNQVRDDHQDWNPKPAPAPVSYTYCPACLHRWRTANTAPHTAALPQTARASV